MEFDFRAGTDLVLFLCVCEMLFSLVAPQSMLGGLSLGFDCFSCSHWLILSCLLRNPVFPSLRFHLQLKITQKRGGTDTGLRFLLGSFWWIKVPLKWSAVNRRLCTFHIWWRFLYEITAIRHIYSSFDSQKNIIKPPYPSCHD